MASDLLSIAYSGTRAARSSLEVTAQNIANADTDGYVRRSANIREVAASPGFPYQDRLTLAGSRVAGVERNIDPLLAAEARRSSSEFEGAKTLLSGLKAIEGAIEAADPFGAIVGFEESLQALQADPVNTALRIAVIGKAETVANAFRHVSGELGAQSVAAAERISYAVDEVNQFAGSLAKLNEKIARAGLESSGRAHLLDQRDLLLSQLNERADIAVSFESNGTVKVQIGDDRSSALVSGTRVGTFTWAADASGVATFQVNGANTNLRSGAIDGLRQTQLEIGDAFVRLDQQADNLRQLVNASQSAGSDLSGAPGSPLFGGSTAGTMSVVITGADKLATAPAGASPMSRDTSNLDNLRASLSQKGIAQASNQHLFDVSTKVVKQDVTVQAVGAVSNAARAALQLQAGVDLEQEAANLVRFQQAFEASARAMQTATEIFDTLLGIG
ncbi:flagellar hook-associated protein FlgK [Sphingomicrobium astaxanthinifaciens]|uniref:flagellar hook-associated protein FlgK n=1 Tax=Sphingomicrobium astaxanthinifaciens TaxID=1227949 RepID=UPI001FCBA9FA|nr:flagellar hook-associated protein FlgK [Sphingomicrobium astaxanthinifaciens]MCJ7420374.1 flagellar hook-associated protein FlgK [Sphingomicrobium astaxanthinifaciens]